MTFLRVLPALFASLILGAHFLRSGDLALVLLALALPCFLLVRRTWARRLVQAGLLLGALEWLWALATLARERQAAGLPVLRLVLILGTVAAFTAWSAWLLRRLKTGPDSR